jgi:hypothetical protein
LDQDFVPFAAFPDYGAVYRSTELFRFFTDRIASTAAADYDQLIAALGLTRRDATPVELLARSWGSAPHDTIQVVPEPVRVPGGVETMPFLASGVRHVTEGQPAVITARVERLKREAVLSLKDEPDNPSSERAIVLECDEGPVGWMPAYLLDYVHKQRGEKEVRVSVLQSNGADVPWHLRLLCLLEVSP